MTADEIIFERRGGLGIIRLNRPKVLNTLSLAMYRKFDSQLIVWRNDPTVEAVVVTGEGDRAFCAGGDVRAIYYARMDGDVRTDFFREEYALIARVHRFPKPYIALMDGIVMGGGAGIAVNGLYRVATERTLFAMPEVHIGLFPDVGASRFLNLCPGHIGLYLALTGIRIGAADALYCGFATHYIASADLPSMVDILSKTAWRNDVARPQLDAVLSGFGGEAGSSTLAAIQRDIDRLFAGRSVEAIYAALADETADWAKEAHAAMGRASPLSMKIAFRQLQLGKGMNIAEALALEYRLTRHALVGHDFFEGIRAILVDKDNSPRWQHPSPAAVGEHEVDRCFVPLGKDESQFG